MHAQEALADARDEDDRQPAEHEAQRTRARGTRPPRGSARRRRCFSMPWSMPYADQQRARPSNAAACAISTSAAPTIASRCGRSMREQALERPCSASSRDSVSSGTESLQKPPITGASPARRRRRRSSATPRPWLAPRPPRGRAPRGTRRSTRAGRRGCRRRSPCRRRSARRGRRARSSPGRWAMMIVVRPCITSASAARISCSFDGSTDDVASSRMRMRGSASTARAIAMRCRCPPDSE